MKKAYLSVLGALALLILVAYRNLLFVESGVSAIAAQISTKAALTLTHLASRIPLASTTDGVSVVRAAGPPGFGVIENLYYRNGDFFVFSSGDAQATDRALLRIQTPNPDYQFHHIVSASAPEPDLTLRHSTWVLLSSPGSVSGFVGHYYHFLEFVLGLWPVSQLGAQNNKVTGVQHALMGPRLRTHEWNLSSQGSLNLFLLSSLFPGVTIWDADHALANDTWVLIERAVIADRWKSTDDDLVRKYNKMTYRLSQWALAQDPTIYESMKLTALSHMNCSLQLCGYHDKVPSTLVAASFAGGVQVQKPRLSYISRQNSSRHMDSRTAEELERMFRDDLSLYFEIRVVYMEAHTAREQIEIAAHTDIMLGIHGNGLS
jgi:hypothetical protein